MVSGNGLFHGRTSGDGEIKASVIDANGDLYICGEFDSVAGVPGTENIARWDGESWHALDEGVLYYCEALAVDSQGHVYVGGEFNEDGASGVDGTNYIAKWNGSSWEALSEGLNSTVFALAVDSQDDLYVLGEFDTEWDDGTLSLNGAAKWNGSSWESLGIEDVGFGRTALVVDGDDNVYAAINETNILGIPEADHIAMWERFFLGSFGRRTKR